MNKEDANKLHEFGSATKLSNKAKHVDTSKAIRVVAEVSKT
jgi:hypothetical protein